jgi:TorA maturation chaperone TorD
VDDGLKKSPSSDLRSLDLENDGDVLLMNYAAIKECDKNSPNHTYRSISLDKNFFDEDAALALKNVFFFLGLIFRYPDESVYAEIQKHMDSFNGFFMEYGDGKSPSLPPITDLQAEYVSLFVNNKGFVPALPYASPHMDKGLLMGSTYFWIKNMLRETGLSLDSSVSELEDHLAILLESCACLINGLIEKPFDDEKNRARLFVLREITSCIKDWIDDFEDKIHSYASLEFYKVSADSLKNFIHEACNIYEQTLGLHQRN